jgi:short-subunit dehydrogenase
MVAFTETLRGEYQGTGISASVICPGFTDDGGIYERMKKEIGRGTPPLMGHTTADKVAKAVVRAIRSDKAEIIVNSPPMRPIAVLCQVVPSIGQSMVRIASKRFLRKVAQSRRNEE